MDYAKPDLPETEIPRASDPLFQHILDTYASETNKTAALWRELRDEWLDFRPHPRSSSVAEILKHQLLSERRFFAEFIGLGEPPADQVLPGGSVGVARYADRLAKLARARLPAMADRDRSWWLEPVPFFDVRRERIWVFWRRVLHSAHHRTQLGLYLRLHEARVPPTYGPTADVTWQGADPTRTVDAAGRRPNP
jgi:uncharacterized damage-inducible protein DinB